MRISDWSSDVCSSDLRHIHENIERGGDRVGRDAMGRQGFGEIAVAAAMNGLVRIEMAKGRLAARRQQKVVHADAILDNFEHRARAVRTQAVARGHDRKRHSLKSRHSSESQMTTKD